MAYDNLSKEKIRETLELRLKDFDYDDREAPDLIWECENEEYPVERQYAPVPGLLHLTLVGILEFRPGWRGDKTHWAIPFKYKGIRCSLAFQKFGLRLYTARTSQNRTRSVNPREIIGKLHRSILYLEKVFLHPFGKTQIAHGNVTVSNHFHRLDDMYQYFREQAENSYRKMNDVRAERPKEGGSIESLVDNMHVKIRSELEGFYNTLAMIDAYFSRLEHIFVLCLPFAGYSRESDDLVKFIGSNWADKYKRVFGVNPGSKAKRFYDSLDSIKERFRNTFAHGGFEKAGSSLYFHLPGFGALPASLTSVKDSPHFHFIPVQEATLQDVNKLFDNFDEWLKTESMPEAMRYAESALNMSFDENSISVLIEKSKDIETFEKWLRAETRHQDMIENVDY